MSYAAPSIAKDFSISASLMGVIMSSFFLGYALMQLPGGLLADKFGTRKVLMVITFVWSLFTALTGAAWSPVSMILFRFFFGLGEGAFMATAVKAISEVYPRKERARANSVMMIAMGITVSMGPVLFTNLIAVHGWRTLFYSIGVLGLIVIILYFFFFKIDNTRQDDSQIATQKVDDGETVSLSQFAKMPMMWSLALVYLCMSFVMWGLNSWVPTYLANVRGLELVKIGWLQVGPSTCTIISYLITGYVLDKISLNATKITGFIVAVVTAVSLFIMVTVESLTVFFICQGLSLGCMGFIGLFGNNIIMKRFSPDVVGAGIGFIGFGAQIGAFAAPLTMGLIIDSVGGSFTVAFRCLAFLALVCAIGAFSLPNLNKKKPTEQINS